MNRGYRSEILKELRDQQVRFAPREKKLEQAERAERLLADIDPQRVYSYEFLCFRITEFRPDPHPQRTAIGSAVRHDLRLFVEDVSESAKVRWEDATERVFSVDELSQRFHVATRTISRWREMGLIGRRFLSGGRPRLGFLQSSVDRFIEQYRDHVERGCRFTRLADAETRDLFDAARRLAAEGAGVSETVRHLAEITGRSVETIRYTLKDFDARFPHLAVFPHRRNRLAESARLQLYDGFRSGTPAAELAKTFQLTPGSVYRIVSEMRARKIADLTLNYVPSPEFHAKNTNAILGTTPSVDATETSRPPDGIPPYLARLYDFPLLSPAQERHLFRRYNFLKFLASTRRETLPPRPRARDLDAIESHYAESQAVKNQIVQANLRLVVSVARRHISSSRELHTLVSEGNLTLIRCVETFDYNRGNKFSTYATWPLMKCFARSVPPASSPLPTVEPPTPGRTELGYDQESEQLGREQSIERILSRLDEREQRIIITRFGLGNRQEPRTLQQVGDELGVTKERIRQIERRALEKLRDAVEQEKIDFHE